jgi:hypothetical protein
MIEKPNNLKVFGSKQMKGEFVPVDISGLKPF